MAPPHHSWTWDVAGEWEKHWSFRANGMEVRAVVWRLGQGAGDDAGPPLTPLMMPRLPQGAGGQAKSHAGPLQPQPGWGTSSAASLQWPDITTAARHQQPQLQGLGGPTSGREGVQQVSGTGSGMEVRSGCWG